MKTNIANNPLAQIIIFSFLPGSMFSFWVHGAIFNFHLKLPFLGGTASRASVATLRQKNLTPFHFCLAKNSYPLPPFSFSSQTRFTGLCSEPHMLGTNCPEEFGCVTGANAPVPCFCRLACFQTDGQCWLSRLWPRAYRSAPADIQHKAFSYLPQVCGVFLLVRPC